MRHRLVLFDFDGTLADSFPWFASMLNEVAARFGFRQLPPEAIDELRGLDTQAILRRLEVPVWKLPAIAAHMRTRIAADIHQMQLFPGIPEALRTIAARADVGIVSSNAAPTIQRILGPETAALVRHWECGASLFGKASRLKRVLGRAKVPAAEAIFVGDEIRDARAAKSCGLRFGAVSWGYNLPAALAAEQPDLLFASVAEMAAAL